MDALTGQALALYTRPDPTEPWCETGAVHDAMTRHTRVIAGVKRPPHLASSAWSPEHERDLAIRGDATARHAAHQRMHPFIPSAAGRHSTKRSQVGFRPGPAVRPQDLRAVGPTLEESDVLTVFKKSRERETGEIERAERAMRRCIEQGHTAEGTDG